MSRHAKSWIAAATAGSLLVATGTYATIVGVTAHQDAAGNQTVPECQPLSQPLRVQNDDPVYDAQTHAWVVTGVTVLNVADACVDAQLGLYLTPYDVNRIAIQRPDPQLLTSSPSSRHFTLTAGLGLTGGIPVEHLEGWAVALHPFTLPGVTDLTALAASSTTVDLSWTAPTELANYPAIDYVVEYSSDGGTIWSTFADGTGTDPFATVTGLTGDTTYLFRVSTVNAGGTGAPTVSSPVLTSAPEAPVSLSASAASSTSVALDWTPPPAVPGGPVLDYIVQASADGGDSWSTFPDGQSAATDATVGGLSTGTPYLFKVAAKNDVGTGPAAITDTPVVPDTVPSEPLNVRGVSGDHQVVLTWSAPADTGGAAITDYTVDYAANNDAATWTTFADGTSTATTATITGLTNGGAGYYFRVSATNRHGTGQPSTSQPLVVPAAAPDAPTQLSIDAGKDHADVSWHAPASDGGAPLVGYTVSTPLGNGNYASCTTSTELTCRITGLTPSTSYTFTLTATNAAGHSATATASATTMALATVPGAPSDVSGTPQDGAVLLTWSAPDDGGTAITGYTANSVPDGATCTTTGSLACTVTGLTDGTAYVFRVTATNAIGTGSYGQSASVTPATLPSTPATVTATSTGTSGEIALSWSAPVSDGGSAVTDYAVQYSVGSGSTWYDVTHTPSTSRSRTVTGLVDGLALRFRVAAVNVIGAGPMAVPSAPVAATAHIGDPGVPGPILTTGKDDAIALTWTAPEFRGASVTGYEVAYKCSRVLGSRQDHCADTSPYQDWSAWYPTGSATTDALIASDGVSGAELFDGNDYVFRVRALITVGGVTNTGEYAATTSPDRPSEGCTPNAPVGVSATVNNTTSIGLSWIRDPGPAPDGSMPPVGCLGVPIDPRTHYYYMVSSSSDGSTWSDWSAPTDTHSIATANALSGLAENTWYRFIVEEWPDNDNRGPWSSPSSPVRTGTFVTPPGRPTAPTATPGDTSSALTWSAPVGTGGATIDAYRVTAYTDAAGILPALGPVQPQTLTSGGTFTGLTNGTPYWFRVEAHNSAGWGTPSDVSASTVPRTTPGAPGTPTANATAGDGTVSLSWVPPSSTGGSAITDYTLDYSTNSGSTWTTFPHPASAATSITVTGLSTGVGYLFRVAATNAAGTGSASSASSSTTPYTVSTAPTSPGATTEASLTVGQTSTYLDLTWVAPANNGGSPITGYIVQMSADSGSTWNQVAAPTSSSAHITGLPVSTTLALRVRAVTAATRPTDTGYSWVTVTTVTATPPAPTPPPPPTPAVPQAVTNLTATAGNTLVTLTWTASVAPGAAVTGYAVRFSANAGTSWTNAATTSATTTTVTGLTNGTTYTFEVTPQSTSGAGPSTTITAQPTAVVLVPPTAVRSLTANAGASSITLAWLAPTQTGSQANPSGYVVQRSSSSGEGGTQWTTATTVGASALTATVSNLTPGTTYTFRVFATSTVGNGAIAASVSAVPANAGSNFTTIPSNANAAWTGGTVTMTSVASVLSSTNSSQNPTVTATGSMTTGSTGWGIWVRASVADSKISGYDFQIDPGYPNEFILRWWSNGSERSQPLARAKFPTGFDATASHTVIVRVTSGTLYATVDGTQIYTTVLPTASMVEGTTTFTPCTGTMYGFRTWYPTVATINNISVAGGQTGQSG